QVLHLRYPIGTVRTTAPGLFLELGHHRETACSVVFHWRTGLKERQAQGINPKGRGLGATVPRPLLGLAHELLGSSAFITSLLICLLSAAPGINAQSPQAQPE